VHAAAHDNKPIIRDPLQNIEADHVRFLGDILQYRLKISNVLPTEILDDNGMIQNNDNFILLSAPSSYQFLVALFAILAVGGAAVLLRMFPIGMILTSPLLVSDGQALDFSAWYRS
jgi:hypothetical protein